jgi:hypothetical protein
MRYLLPLLALSATPLAAQADLSIAVRAGTMGVGGEVAKLILPNVAVRVGVHTLTYTIARTKRDIAYDVEAKFSGMTALVDLFPSKRGTFHFTGGLMTAPIEIDGTGQPTDGTYTFNGRDYTAAEAGTVVGEVRWPKTMPYAGLGFGSPASGSGRIVAVLDFGVGFGAPTLGLTASSAVPGSTLAQDVAVERDEIQRDLDKYLKLYPVASFGLGVRF